MTSHAHSIPPQPPPLFNGTASSIVKDMQAIIDRGRKQMDDLAASVPEKDATFDNVLKPMAQQDNQDGLEMEVLTFYQAVSDSQALRDASTEAQKLIKDFSVEASMRDDIFRLVRAIRERKEPLDPESAKLLDESYKDYIRRGMALDPGPARDRFKEIQLKLGKLETDFERNLAEEKGGVWFTMDEVDGVSKDLVASWDKGTGEHEGMVKMNFAYPNYFGTLKYATNATTRRRAYVDNTNKLLVNKPIFSQVITLRDEAARILGFPNHATMRLENRMAKTPERVNDFLGDLRQKLTDGGEQEKTELKELKKKHLASTGHADKYDGKYFLWDQPFYNRMMLEEDYMVDHEKLAEYFPLTTCLPKMLQIFEQLLGLSFVEIVGKDRDAIAPQGSTGKDIVWHDDCHLFSVWDSADQGSGFVGYLYMDLHPRPDKYKHAANFNLQPGFVQPDGKRHYPATALVCNFSPPTASKPSLLKHDEVVTLFHELGHGIHDLVARTTYSRFHGTSVVRDFVEAPSQMLENWCWTPHQLKALSHHYSHLTPEYEKAWHASSDSSSSKPPAELPDDLIDKLVKSKHVNAALFNLRQLHFGIFDQTIYQPSSHAEAQGWKFGELYNKLGWDIQHLDTPVQESGTGAGYDWGNGHTTFAHVISGYDGAYYSYLFSQVFSADMFHSIFAADPMDPKQGRRYRRTVLEKGGSVDAMDLLKEFLGREPSTAPFYKELGLS